MGTSTPGHRPTPFNPPTRYVPSEGAAGLIPKTKSAAICDILAVVRSTDVKHDGRSQGLVAPNVKAQIAMQIALIEKANLAPAEIEYVALIFTITRIIVYLLLVSSKLTALPVVLQKFFFKSVQIPTDHVVIFCYVWSLLIFQLDSSCFIVDTTSCATTHDSYSARRIQYSYKYVPTLAPFILIHTIC
jgi:hypothetical protein